MYETASPLQPCAAATFAIPLGFAYVVNGIIFGLSGQTKEKWQSGGTFEWCMDFEADGLAAEDAGGFSTGVQAGLPWVTDKEMKITFWKEPSYYSSSSQK
jgi:hypothetical protein